MRKLILIAVLFLFATSVQAFSPLLMGGGDAGCGSLTTCSADGMTFYWDMTSATITDGAGCTQGDTSAANTGEVNLTGQKLNLLDTSNGGNDYYKMAPAALNNEIPAGDITVYLKYYCSSAGADDGVLFYWYNGGSTDRLRLQSVDGDLVLLREANNVVTHNDISFNTNLSQDTEYEIILKMRAVGTPKVLIKVDSTEYTDATALTSFTANLNTMAIGNALSATNLEGYIDDFKVFSGWCDDL